MQTQQRKIFAIILILIGILALGFGLWLLYGMIFGGPKDELVLPQAGNNLNVTSRDIPEPQTYEAPVLAQGDSTFDETARGQDVVEATNRAVFVIGLIGSGTSQNGFLGYSDAMSYATTRFQSYLQTQQREMREYHPMNGDLYGITTKVLSSKVLSGENGSQTIVIELQAQVAEDAGDRSRPTKVYYKKFEATMQKQADGRFFVDYLQEEVME
jgi:hypothetical protein